jgi:hypothetical protein
MVWKEREQAGRGLYNSMKTPKSQFLEQATLLGYVLRRIGGHVLVLRFTALFLTLGVVTSAEAAQPTGAVDQVGWYYAVTHMHPAAYFLLFLIFLLSVVNLGFQGWFSVQRWPFAWIMGLLGTLLGSSVGGASSKRQRSRDESYRGYQGHVESVNSGLVGLPRACSTPQAVNKPHVPTPLDGVDHPMPTFVRNPGAQIGAPRIVERQADKQAGQQDFKFSAAVDVPTPQELERREREQVVVSGSVRSTDDTGISAVIVYLTDEKGNRIGQSCRSLADTGEFKVLVNEPGRYFLNAYKRGYVLESSEPMALPIESGKIEGYQVRMIPEGCIVQGRVSSHPAKGDLGRVEVKCICRAGDLTRSSRTDGEGRFRISGIPVNSECYLEAIDSEGKWYGRSAPFQTVQKRDIYQELTLHERPDTSSPPRMESSQPITFRDEPDAEKSELASAQAPVAP